MIISKSMSSVCKVIGEKIEQTNYQPIVVLERLDSNDLNHIIEGSGGNKVDRSPDCSTGHFKIIKEQEESFSKNAQKTTFSEEEISNFDLHLSPETEDNCTDHMEFVDNVPIKTEIKEEPNSETIYPTPNASPCAGSTDNQDSRHHQSQDMFNESQNLQCSQDMFQSSLTPEDTTSPVQRLSGEPNREPTQEWNSQQLTDITQRLEVRRMQVKRMLMAVIRKRQMEDETLESFKKRLRKL